MRTRLPILFVLMFISAVSVANAVDKNAGQADFSSEAGRLYRSSVNAHVAPKDQKAEAAELYEKMLGEEAIPKATAEPQSATISN